MLPIPFSYKAKVVRVVDGDTLDATIDLGFYLTARHRLRVARVNTPETNRPSEREAGLVSKAWVTDQIEGREVLVSTEKADVFGRYLAEVWYDAGGQWVNLSDELLERGLAEPYRK